MDKKKFIEPEVEVVKYENDNLMIFTCGSGIPLGEDELPIDPA